MACMHVLIRILAAVFACLLLLAGCSRSLSENTSYLVRSGITNNAYYLHQCADQYFHESGKTEATLAEIRAAGQLDRSYGFKIGNGQKSEMRFAVVDREAYPELIKKDAPLVIRLKDGSQVTYNW